jgi:hypothetical protein
MLDLDGSWEIGLAEIQYPVAGRDGEMMTRAFDHIQYCPLVLRRFQTVEIDIRDDTGVKIPFERRRVVVTLHCRKRKESYLE